MHRRILLLFCYCSVFLWQEIGAQQKTEDSVLKYRHEIALGVGLSNGRAALQVMYSPSDNDIYVDNWGNVLTLDYIFRRRKRWSWGLSTSYQYFDVRHRVVIPGTPLMAGRYDRINVGIRPLNYLYQNNWFQWYNGFRLSATTWNFRTDPLRSEIAADHRTTLGAIQYLMGIRLYIHNIGIGSELALGTAPYYFQSSASIRF